MTFFLLLYVFILGAVIGSFLNVCIYRLPFGKSIINPPSTCGNCKTRLKAKDLIPILSWLGLKGKCGYCSHKISARYPLIEGLTGILFVASYWVLGMHWIAIWAWAFIAYAIVVAMIDYDHHKIHNKSVFVGLALGLLYRIVEFFDSSSLLNFKDGLLGMIFGFLILFMIAMLSRAFKGNALGFGDVKIYLPLGLILGMKMTLISIWIMFTLSGLVALFYLIFKKDSSKKEVLPLGPMIMFSAFIVWLWSQV